MTCSLEFISKFPGVIFLLKHKSNKALFMDREGRLDMYDFFSDEARIKAWKSALKRIRSDEIDDIFGYDVPFKEL